MSLPYTIRMLGGLATPAAGLEATVPAGYVWVIRDISALAAQAGSINVCVLIAGQAFIWGVTSLTAEASVSWSGRQVANAGEQLQAITQGQNTYFLVSGYQLAVA